MFEQNQSRWDGMFWATRKIVRMASSSLGTAGSRRWLEVIIMIDDGDRKH
jgi:hypothetical protein